MYAVIKTGGKQYRVTPGDVIKVETLDVEVGASYDFQEVLMIADGDKVTVGTPTIASAKVAASVISHGRAKKVEIIKFRRRKHHQKRTGHRQNYTQVQIQNINGDGAPERVMAPKTADATTTEEKPSAKKKATPKKAKAKVATKKTETKAAPKKKEAKAEAPKKETKAKATKKVATKKSTGSDDLTKLEGIGPKAAQAIVDAGVTSFADLAAKKPAEIKTILDEAEGRFGAMKPDTWPKQAKLAAAEKWDELKELQDRIDGGVEKK